MAAIRPVALAAILRGDDLLVAAGPDYYRPPGGGITFAEPAADAVRRELREELGAELSEVELLGVLEDIYTLHGVPAHELAFVYAARFADADLYRRDFAGAGWQPMSAFRAATATLYPSGMVGLIDSRHPQATQNSLPSGSDITM